jgi:hypothetical protein
LLIISSSQQAFLTILFINNDFRIYPSVMMAEKLLKHQFSTLAFVLALCCSLGKGASAAHVSPPPAANPRHQMQNIILLQAKIAPECAGKCSVVIEATSSSSSKGAFPLQAPLRPWNTLTVATEDTADYRAKVVCSNKCQATTGQTSFPLWTSLLSKLPEKTAGKQQLANLTLHTSNKSANGTVTNLYLFTTKGNSKNKNKQEEKQLPPIIVHHPPSSQAVCRAQKSNAASFLKLSSLIIWIAGCPVVAFLVSNSIKFDSNKHFI